MGLIKRAMVFVLLAVGCKYLYEFLVTRGVSVHFNNHYPGQCRQVPGIQCGSEQISVTKDGLAFITNGIKGMTNCNPAYTPGRIYLFDFNHPDNNAVALGIDSSSLQALTFDPHGMDIIEDGESVKLFVVNHGNNEETIEKFIFNRRDGTALQHVDTIRDERFICLNDIAMVTENEFYVTNYIKTCNYPEIFIMMEIFLRLHTGNVLHCKHGKSSVVANGPGFNGVTLSNDKKRLLVASFSTGYLYVYKVVFGTLKFTQMISTGHFPDNIYTDFTSSGNVFFVGTEKHSFTVYSLAWNRTNIHSSCAVKVTVDDEWSKADVEEVLHDNGRNFVRGVTVAVHYKRQYLFGTIFDGLAYCKKYN